MSSLISKTRKPKFDLHLRIDDLNNVPLVSGVSLIKWHLPHSIHKEHRGRTQKCPIANHRVEYSFAKVIPLRIVIDKTGSLADCWIEFEVLQEFGGAGAISVTARDEKVSLGTVRINLSEYIEESEAILRDSSSIGGRRTSLTAGASGDKSGHQRKRSSMSGVTVDEPDISPRSSHPVSELDDDRSAANVQEGVVRRYLLQESKINSTLKISILMIQVDGERNFVAPPLKTAPVFGGIAGFVANDSLEPTDASADAPGRVPSLSNKSRDVSEVQDMYRRALAASWASEPGEMTAEECIEDIFAGGDGFRAQTTASNTHSRHRPTPSKHKMGMGAGLGNSPQSTGSSGNNMRREDSGETSGDDENGDMMGTLRPRDLARMTRHRLRGDSGASDRSNDTILVDRDHHRHRERGMGLPGLGSHRELLGHHHAHHHRDSSRDTTDGGGLRSRSGSAASLDVTLSSSERERGRDGFKRAREVSEFEVREDLVAWRLPRGKDLNEGSR